MTPRTVALLRERALLQKQLARVDSEIADEAAGADGPPELVTPLERQATLQALDRARARVGR